MIIPVFDEVNRLGTASQTYVKYLNSMGFEFVIYDRSKLKRYDGPVFVFNRWPCDLPKGTRIVGFMNAPVLRKNGEPAAMPFERLSHTVFNSEFYQRIVQSAGGSALTAPQAVIYELGGLPVDQDLKPILEPRSIKGPLQFLAVAKWWKRPFKRLGQIEHLYRNYLKAKYPGSMLHVLGGHNEETVEHDGIVYHKKSFHDPDYIRLFKSAHVHITLTPFDTGPRTLLEALHYRVPFLATNNCCGPEIVSKLGSCGEVVTLDPAITSIGHCRKHRPFSNKGFYKRYDFDWDMIVEKIDTIVRDFEKYTSWQWNENLNYESNYGLLRKFCYGKSAREG